MHSAGCGVFNFPARYEINKKKKKKPYIVKLGTVAEHEADVGDELLGRTVEVAAPLVELGSDHRQVNGPFDDLVVVTSLQARERVGHSRVF